jgi:hypothetical protein
MKKAEIKNVKPLLQQHNVSGSAYVFDPLKHGFEPISNYPELGFNYPMIDGYFVKVVCYSDYGGLVYWYKVLSTLIGMKPDDRIEIKSGSYDFRKPSEYGKQTNPTTEYLGLVSNDEFAENLLKHLLGTTRNDSLNTDSITRYNENVGVKMRVEFPQHYR